MDHRLPVTLFLAYSVACSGGSDPTTPAPTDEGGSTTDSHTETDDSGDTEDTDDTEPDFTSYTSYPEDEYVFELDVDGVVKPVYTSLMGVVENSGDACTTSYTLSLNGGEFEDRVQVRVNLAAPAAPGVSAPLGADATHNRGATFWVVEVLPNNYLEPVTYSTPNATITALGVDTFEMQLDAGVICPFIADAGDDTSTCEPFTSATLRLVDAPKGFDPALRCAEDDHTTGGELCYDNTVKGPNNPRFCP